MAHFLADDVQKAVSVHSGKSKEIQSAVAESSLQAVEETNFRNRKLTQQGQ